MRTVKKVVTDDMEVEKQIALLPAWFVQRMMCDEWTFGLLLTTGDVLVISSIAHVHQDAAGHLWLDVNVTDPEPYLTTIGSAGRGVLYCPTTRTTMSINAAQVVAAFEVCDT